MKYEHLICNIENTAFNRSIIDQINKLMKDSNSMYRLQRRYRKPKYSKKSPKWQPWWGKEGSVACEIGKVFSVYLRKRRSNEGNQKDNGVYRWPVY